MIKYKKSEKNLILYLIFFDFFIILSGFISNILGNYTLSIMLAIFVAIFGRCLGFEKDKNRYSNPTIMNVIIFNFTYLCFYYLFGLIIGYAKVNNYYSFYGIAIFIVPTIMNILLKEFLRYEILRKGDQKEIFVKLTFITFTLLDIISSVKLTNMTFKSLFLIYALNILPSISNNILCTYVAKKAGLKPNIIYALIISLYPLLLPIIPNSSEFFTSVINFLVPLLLFYKLKKYFDTEKDNLINRDYNKKYSLLYVFPILLTFILVYFVSGYFTYYSITIGSGSMEPVIKIGDIVIIKQKNFDYSDITEGDILAYNYGNVVIVHRVVNIVVDVDGTRHYYTKGDNNDFPDGWEILDKDIVGIVKVKIPKLGIPTVWLNNMIERGK